MDITNLIDVYVSKYMGKNKYGKEAVWKMTPYGNRIKRSKMDGRYIPVSSHRGVMDKLPSDGRYIIISGYKFRLKID